MSSPSSPQRRLFSEGWEELGIQDPSSNNQPEHGPKYQEAKVAYDRFKDYLEGMRENPQERLGPDGFQIWGAGFLGFERFFDNLPDWRVSSAAALVSNSREAFAYLQEHVEEVERDRVWWEWGESRVVMHYLTLLKLPDGLGYGVKIHGGVYYYKGDLTWQDPTVALGAMSPQTATENYAFLWDLGEET